MKLIVGLGNPGKAYSNHRHNVGFMVLDLLARRHDIGIAKKQFGAIIGSGAIAGQAAILAAPQTFMNLSGDAVGPLLRFYKLDIDDLIVVHDDLDIELGKMKIMKGAGHGGHNGLRSIIETLGTNEFLRVRVGIGRPPAGMDSANYVLHSFDDSEEKIVSEVLKNSADAVEMLLNKGLSAAQQKFH